MLVVATILITALCLAAGYLFRYTSYLEPGFLWGPRWNAHPDAVAFPNSVLSQGQSRFNRWPWRSHPDAVGFFERRRVVRDGLGRHT